MAQMIAIPGRRVSNGETFYTDWVPRGGDCVILRVQVLHAVPGGEPDTLAILLETRGEDGSTPVTITATSPSGGLSAVTTTGVKTCVYLAFATSTSGNGAQEQVRVRVSCTNLGSAYYVLRVFPLIFFDSAKPY